MNPPDQYGKQNNHKSYGINQMRQMFEMGTFYVNENCSHFLTEAQNYFVDEKGRFSDPDDCIDSCRYAIMAVLQGIAEPWDGMSSQQRMRAQRERYVKYDDSQRPSWKKTYTAE